MARFAAESALGSPIPGGDFCKAKTRAARDCAKAEGPGPFDVWWPGALETAEGRISLSWDHGMENMI